MQEQYLKPTSGKHQNQAVPPSQQQLLLEENLLQSLEATTLLLFCNAVLLCLDWVCCKSSML